MNTPEDFSEATSSQLDDLRQRVSYLQEALAAISSGGVDAVIVGQADQEQLYTLTNADRPYRVIVESMGEGAVTVSESGVILYANPQLAGFLGVERDTMVGRDIAAYVGQDQQAELATLLGAATPETRRVELVIERPDGTEVPFLVSATDLDIEGVLVRCLVLTDLTMQKLVEHKSAVEAAQAQRHLAAREVNDTIVQGLVAAEMALDLGQVGYARSVVARTSRQARNWIGNLAGDTPLAPGMAVRSSPARRDEESP